MAHTISDPNSKDPCRTTYWYAAGGSRLGIFGEYSNHDSREIFGMQVDAKFTSGGIDDDGKSVHLQHVEKRTKSDNIVGENDVQRTDGKACEPVIVSGKEKKKQQTYADVVRKHIEAPVPVAKSARSNFKGSSHSFELIPS